MIRHKDYLLPEVAEGTRNINLNTPGYLAYQVGANWSYIKLPPGTLQLIGLAAELTEEQKIEIVDKPNRMCGGKLFDYKKRANVANSPDESFASLLRSHNLNANQIVIIKEIKK